MKSTIHTFGTDARPLLLPQSGDVRVSLEQVEGDPESVFRLYLTRGQDCRVEICPSKGLSVRDTTLKGRQVFWDSPLPNLPDPTDIDLEGTMVVGGHPMPGMTWVEYFAAHVEMLGPVNWGMVTNVAGKKASGWTQPLGDDDNLLCLHGNASMIPITEVTVETVGGGATVEGCFLVRNANGSWPPSDDTPLFRITKRIELPAGRDVLILADTIENVSNMPLFPDWGYHVQLRPEPGCRLLMPSESAAPRGGGELESDWETWKPAVNPRKREERGYIHKGIRYDEVFQDGSPAFECRLEYPDGSCTRCLLPPSPYVMSWFSCGGAEDDEFVRPDGSKWLHRNWDGVGPEIGTSALDHDGDVDPAIRIGTLAPGEITVINMEIEPIL